MPNPSSVTTQVKRPRGRPPIPVVEYPSPLWETEAHPLDFHGALDMQMRRHGEPANRLHRAVKAAGGLTDGKTISDWRRGSESHGAKSAKSILARVRSLQNDSWSECRVFGSMPMSSLGAQ